MAVDDPHAATVSADPDERAERAIGLGERGVQFRGDVLVETPGQTGQIGQGASGYSGPVRVMTAEEQAAEQKLRAFRTRYPHSLHLHE